MNVISIMWTPFPGSPATAKQFEVAFQNANTDVRVVTSCASETQDTSGAPSGGCELVVTPDVWKLIAGSNRGGAPVKVSVRATSDGSCATSSASTVGISFSQQDLDGGMFYWKSTISSIGVGGQIWAKSFGDATPEEQITGTGNNSYGCFGCHSLSRDGLKMVVNVDDNDSDDEYGDVTSMLIDVKTKTADTSVYGVPGFQTFDPDHSLYFGTDGRGTAPSNVFYLTDTTMTGATATTLTLAGLQATDRPTMPDWSPDGKSVIFVVPQSLVPGPYSTDDDHVFAGSLYTATWDATAKTLGMATPLIKSAGENNYYPSYSPDGTYIVFNRVPMQPGGAACTSTTSQGSCANDSFSNPKARIMLLANKPNAAPVDAEKANGSPAAAPVDVSNSWPRWSPFVQMYNGTPLLWVTFSSTRDYGLKVQNHKTGSFQCYPAESPEQTSYISTFPAGCQQPQIWMAAINLQALELGQGDPSFPAFWLPFQDITTHNHTAQWTETVATQPPPPDMGMCLAEGMKCTSDASCCTMHCSTVTGTCITPIP
jgi:hypothetical protein